MLCQKPCTWGYATVAPESVGRPTCFEDPFLWVDDSVVPIPPRAEEISELVWPGHLARIRRQKAEENEEKEAA